MESVTRILSGRARECRHSGAFLARNGALPQFGAWCDQCARWVTKELLWHPGLWLPSDHEKLAGLDLEAAPIRPTAWFRHCERCDKWAVCEVHHMAPRKFFGEACESWPTVYLCRPCHEQWHTIVTPGLCTEYDPAAHAAQLLGYLGVANLRRLWLAVKAANQEAA